MQVVVVYCWYAINQESSIVLGAWTQRIINSTVTVSVCWIKSISFGVCSTNWHNSGQHNCNLNGSQLSSVVSDGKSWTGIRSSRTSICIIELNACSISCRYSSWSNTSICGSSENCSFLKIASWQISKSNRCCDVLRLR